MHGYAFLMSISVHAELDDLHRLRVSQHVTWSSEFGLDTYSDEYRDLVREYKILSSDSITLHESTLIERFIAGLSNRYSILVSALRLRQADTLESAISTLLECDECSQEKLIPYITQTNKPHL